MARLGGGAARLGAARLGMARRGKEKGPTNHHHRRIQMETTENTTEQNADMWPLDPRHYPKGSMIDPVSLGLISTDRSNKRYQLDLLRLKQEIERVSDQLKLRQSYRIDHDRIRVMTDAEALDYHQNAAARALHNMGKQASHLRNRIEVHNLDDNQRTEHTRNTALWALRYQSARKVTNKRIEQQQAPATIEAPRTLG